jgi:hypothetical protein
MSLGQMRQAVLLLRRMILGVLERKGKMTEEDAGSSLDAGPGDVAGDSEGVDGLELSRST